MKLYLAGILCLASLDALAQDPKPAAQGATAKNFTVEGANDEYVDTGINVKSGDLVYIRATGSVVTGSWNGATKDANGHMGKCQSGTDTDGALIMKVGTSSVIRVGDEYLSTMDKEGALKLKVRDTKYVDNSGAYNVTVTHVPRTASLTTKSVTVEAANDEWTTVEGGFDEGGLVFIVASGTVTIRGAQRTAEGRGCSQGGASDDDGGLAVKVGKTLLPKAGTMAIQSPGKTPLKFRVRSGNKYDENTGSYEVSVAHVAVTTAGGE